MADVGGGDEDLVGDEPNGVGDSVGWIFFARFFDDVGSGDQDLFRIQKSGMSEKKCRERFKFTNVCGVGLQVWQHRADLLLQGPRWLVRHRLVRRRLGCPLRAARFAHANAGGGGRLMRL